MAGTPSNQLYRTAMDFEDDDTLIVLDDETDEWLTRLSVTTGNSRAEIVASILRDIRIDDQRHHAN
jgi:hypothetical protein